MITLILALCCCLSQYRAPTLDDYLKQLEDKDVHTRRNAAEYLDFVCHNHIDLPDEKVTGPLLRALRDSDAHVRWQVVNIFTKFNQVYKPAISVFGKLLRDDKDVDVRVAAAYALLRFAPAAKDEIATLKEAKKHENKYVQLYAGAAVARLEPDDEKALRFVLQFSKDDDTDLQNSAIDVFAHLGVRTIPALKPGLTDKSPEVRAWTIAAIIATRQYRDEDAKFPPDVIPLLIKSIDDDNKMVASQAIYAVSRLGPRAKGAIPAMVRRFKDPDWQMRQRAIHYLEAFGSAAESAVPSLKNILNDDNKIVRAAAERALRSIDEAKKKEEDKKKDETKKSP